MSYLLRFLDSTVTQKAVAAATGMGLIGFVVVHMAGNLQLFLGADAINSYAVKLKSLGPLLWVARIGLLALVTLHIAITVRLAIRNRRATAGGYAVTRHQASTRSSRYMIVSGSVILLFILFHLAHFTFGWIQPGLHEMKDAAGRHDVYSMVTLGLRNTAIAAFYLIAMLFLFSHLSHAAYSALQTLGLPIGGKDSAMKPVAKAVAVVTVIGFASIPLAVLMGWLPA